MTEAGRSSMDRAMSIVTLFHAFVVLLSALIHGALGLGFPMVATPLIAFTENVRTTMVILIFPTISINIVSIFHGGKWSESIGKYWPLAASSVLGSLLGTELLISVDPSPFRLLLAGVILLYLNLHRLGLKLGWMERRPVSAMLLFGVFSGFLAGTVNVMVPVLIIFALEMKIPPISMVQVFNFCFISGKTAQLAVMVRGGLIGPATFVSSLPFILISVAGLLAGMAFRSRIPAETYRGWLRKALYCIVIVLTAQYAFGGR